MGALTFQQRRKLSPRIIVSQFILSLSIQYSVSLNNNERESSLTRLCGTNPVENSRKRRKAGPRFQIPLESREHWFFLLDIGNSNSRSARGIFREQRKCSLVLNRVANYYRARETRNAEYKEGARAFQRNLANSISHFPWRHGMKFLLSPRKSRIPIFYAPFFETCVCASGRKRFLGLCNWVVACPDPDECRVTSAPLIFPSSSFVKVSINKRTQSFHHPHC